MESNKDNSEWKFVSKKKKNNQFSIDYWIKDLLYKIETDNFKIEDIMDLKSKCS